MAGDPRLNAELQAQYQQNSSWFTLLAAVVGGAVTRDSAEQNNPGDNGALIEVRLSGRTGTITFTPVIQSLDDSGNVLTLVSFAAISADGNYLFYVHPHADKTATSKNSYTDLGTSPIPRRWRLELTVGGAGTWNSEAHACYVK